MPTPPDAQHDAAFRLDWRVQRIAWVVFMLLLALAAAGLFGHGPLSSAQATGGGALIEYERFLRREAPADLRIECDLPPEGDIVMWIDRRYAHKADIERIMPEPSEVNMNVGRLTLTFKRPKNGSRFAATLRLRPHQAGVLDGVIGFAADDESETFQSGAIRFRQIVYP